MKQREVLFGFGGVILGFLLATIILIVAERRQERINRVGNVVHSAHLASILHAGRVRPLSDHLRDEISMGIRLLGNRKLNDDDVRALRAVDKICRARGIPLTPEASAVLAKNGARAQ